MEPLNQPLHHVSEVLLILDGEHADEVDDFLDQSRELKVDVFYQSHENVFVVVYEVVVEVLEEDDVPVDYDLLGVGLVDECHLILVAPKLILELLENILKVVFVFHDFEDQAEDFFVDFLHQVLE